MSSYSLFISDVHLNPDKPQTIELFLNWCQSPLALEADSIYVLGDFFDAWIGDDDDAKYIKPVIKAFNNLHQASVKVFFMVGNHDFLVGHDFAAKAKMTFIHDPSIIKLYGNKILLCHGDYLCSDDRLHQAFRRVGTWRFCRWLYHCLPLQKRRQIADYLRSRSRKHVKPANKHIIDVNDNCVRQNFIKYKVKTMIHGHTHKPAVHIHQVAKNTSAKRYVLGCWYYNAEILYVSSDGNYEIRSIKDCQ